MREMMWMVVMVILGEPPERGHAAQGTNSTAVPTEGMSPAEGTALPAATAPHGRAGLARSPAPPTAVPGRCARIGGAPGLGSTPAGAVGGADPIGPARPSATLRALRSAAMAAAPAGRAGLGWGAVAAVGRGAAGPGRANGALPFSPQKRRPGSGCCAPSRRRWVRGCRPAAVPRPVVPLVGAGAAPGGAALGQRELGGPAVRRAGRWGWGAAVPRVGHVAETRCATENREHPWPRAEPAGRLCRALGACGVLFVSICVYPRWVRGSGASPGSERGC